MPDAQNRTLVGEIVVTEGLRDRFHPRDPQQDRDAEREERADPPAILSVERVKCGCRWHRSLLLKVRTRLAFTQRSCGGFRGVEAGPGWRC
jgi:hypothetical protein